MIGLNSREPKLGHQPPYDRFGESVAHVWRRNTTVIAVFAAAAILVHLILRFGVRTGTDASHSPLPALAVFGFVKGHFTGVPKLKGALQTARIGSLAAGVAGVMAQFIA